MSPKSIAAPFTLLLLIVPAASASDDTHPAIGHAMDDGTIQLTLTVGGAHEAGDVLPLCQGSPPIEIGAHVLGTTNTTCFQTLDIDTANPHLLLFTAWATPIHADVIGNAGPVCVPVGGSILPEGGPPVVVEPDEGCINAILDEILG